MIDDLIRSLDVRSKEEIVAELRGLIQRHRRRFIKKYLRPCPHNCQQATLHRGVAIGCAGCGSTNPEQCADDHQFAACDTKEELFQEFAKDLHDIEVLRHDYRDIMVLMWVLNIPMDDETANQTVDSIAVRVERQGTE